MIRFAKGNIRVYIKTESVDDGVRFFITIPIGRHGLDGVVQAFKSAGFGTDDYNTYDGEIRFKCLIGSYEEAEKRCSTFVNSLIKDGFHVTKRKQKRYASSEIFGMFD